MRASAIKKRLGDLLVDVGIISSVQLKQALDAQKRTGGKLGTILAQMGLINEEVMLAFLGKQCGVSYVSLAEYGDIPFDVIRSVPESIVRHQNLIPISKEGKVITIAMSDPFNVFAIDDIKMITGFDVQVVIASESEISAAIDNYYSLNGGMVALSKAFAGKDKKLTPEKEAALIEKSIIAPLLGDALKAGADKIFFESRKTFMSVRVRLDGYLKEQARLPSELASRVADYFAKHLRREDTAAGHNEYEARIEINERKTKVIVSLVEGILGLNAAVAVRGELVEPLELGELGFEPETLSIFRKNIEMPGGLLLITGPARSGKSTTLYSAMKALNYPDRKILSFSPAAEFSVDGAIQVASAGLQARELSKIVSAHDPDAVFIEDILSGGNAFFAVNTALSGRTVFATMTASNPLEAISKLLISGIPPALIASSLAMVSSQKLMRAVCPGCKETYELPSSMLKPFGYEPGMPDENQVKLRKAAGCQDCNNTGYASTTAVFEVFETDERIKSMISEKTPETAMREHYAQKKFTTLNEAALRKVLAGLTTMEEFLRITKLN